MSQLSQVAGKGLTAKSMTYQMILQKKDCHEIDDIEPDCRAGHVRTGDDAVSARCAGREPSGRETASLHQ
jgi:hypothetical protein